MSKIIYNVKSDKCVALNKGSQIKKIIALAAIAAACSTSAIAQSVGQIYGEAMYDTFSMKDTSSEKLGTSKPKAVRLNVGTY